MDRVMQNELVLQVIATNLPVRDILSLRRTSRIWNHAFVAVLRIHGWTVELYPSIASLPATTGEGKSMKRVRNFTTSMRSSQGIPYSSFILHIRGRARKPDQMEQICHFLDVCGQYIRRLEVRFDVQDREPNVGEFLHVIFKKAHGIEVLSLWVSTRPTANYVDLQLPASRTVPVLQTLKFAPHHLLASDPGGMAIGERHHLKQLRLTVPLDESSNNVPVIQGLRNSGELTYLKSINLDFATTTMLSALIETGSIKKSPLRLSRFATSTKRFEPGQVQLPQELLYHFLSTQVDSLRQLELEASRILFIRDANVNRMTHDSPLRIPHLRQLQKFSLSLVGEHYPIQFDGGSLQAAFPFLNSFAFTLSISHDNEVWQDKRFTHEYEVLAHVGVTNLGLKFIQNDRLVHFGNWFPAVTWLDIQLGERDLDHFSLLWTTWPGLESLIVTLPKYFMQGEVWDLDQLLTGIPKSGLEAAKIALTEIIETDHTVPIDRLRVIQSQYKTSGGLRDLGHLQKFVLKRKADRLRCEVENSVNFSDVGGYLGLALASPTLQHIEVDELWRPVDGQNCCSLTHKCLNVIRSGLSRPKYVVLSICGILI